MENFYLMQPVRILIVDEQSVIRAGIRTILTKHQDVEVVGEATCLQEALYAVKAVRPNMVLLDTLMPYLNGYETALQISALEASFLIKQIDPKIKLIVFTTHAHPGIIEALIRGGISATVLSAQTGPCCGPVYGHSGRSARRDLSQPKCQSLPIWFWGCSG